MHGAERASEGEKISIAMLAANDSLRLARLTCSAATMSFCCSGPPLEQSTHYYSGRDVNEVEVLDAGASAAVHARRF